MPLLFPSTPSVGQQYSYGGRTWQWSGSVWQSVGTIQGLQGTQGGLGGAGIQGIQGLLGSQGTTGSQGVQGLSVQGIQGPNSAITFSANPPSSPLLGDRWTDSNSGVGYTWVTDGVNYYWVELSASGYSGIQGNQGVQGPAGSMQGLQGVQGIQGPTTQGIQGPSGFNNFNQVSTDILPTQDNIYGLGNADYRWQNINVTTVKFSDGTIVTSGGGNTAYTPTWAGTGLAFTGTPATGYYEGVAGSSKGVHFSVSVACTTVTNFGSGSYTITLPTNSLAGANIAGDLLVGTTRYRLTGLTTAGSNVVTLYITSGNATHTMTAFAQGNPATLTTASNFRIYGTYLAQ